MLFDEEFQMQIWIVVNIEGSNIDLCNNVSFLYTYNKSGWNQQ